MQPLKNKVSRRSGVSRRSVTPRDLSNTGSPAGFPKTRAKKRRGMWRIKSAMLSLCLCECGPHSPIATVRPILLVCLGLNWTFGWNIYNVSKNNESEKQRTWNIRYHNIIEKNNNINYQNYSHQMLHTCSNCPIIIINLCLTTFPLFMSKRTNIISQDKK